MTTTDMPRKIDAGPGRPVRKKRSGGSATGGIRRAIAPTTLLWVLAGLYGRKSGRGFYDYADPQNPKPMNLL